MATMGQSLNQLKPGTFTTTSKVHPTGSLEARKLREGGIIFYWRFSQNRKTHRIPIGPYDPYAPPKSYSPSERGYSIAAAKRKAETMAMEHSQNLDHGGYIGLQAAKRQTLLEQQTKNEKRSTYSFLRLMQAYADHLQHLGRSSHREVRSITNVHISRPWPELAALAASEITVDHIADMMRKCIEAGKGRTANKLRSYVRSAFEVAKSARSKPSIPVEFKSFEIRHNPAVDTSPDEMANRADKNPLSIDELRAYWNSIVKIEGFKGAILRLHLLTGGQRIAQFVRLRTQDISSNSIMLYDGKGRPGKAARPHVIPLTRHAATALQQCHATGVYALSTDGGNTHVSNTTLSKWACEAAPFADFQLKRVRSGVETALASIRTSSDIRGRLQSHGISGVQARHYDGYEYLAEKHEALDALATLIEQ
ncbi:tyrosine-type recombinase/integrase [Lampropedia aestuarii]|uniref:tyrosine-type recombinase/integrase n=1 Tax=Lampropedia aestuarii TaxID=2562762 RepID=UPI002468BB12|nr:integrase [Lampropedia aestuarii]MDH5858819.1 integrase [Lampropedia aestuarii]